MHIEVVAAFMVAEVAVTALGLHTVVKLVRPGAIVHNHRDILVHMAALQVAERIEHDANASEGLREAVEWPLTVPVGGGKPNSEAVAEEAGALPAHAEVRGDSEVLHVHGIRVPRVTTLAL